MERVVDAFDECPAEQISGVRRCEWDSQQRTPFVALQAGGKAGSYHTVSFAASIHS